SDEDLEMLHGVVELEEISHAVADHALLVVRRKKDADIGPRRPRTAAVAARRREDPAQQPEADRVDPVAVDQQADRGGQQPSGENVTVHGHATLSVISSLSGYRTPAPGIRGSLPPGGRFARGSPRRGSGPSRRRAPARRQPRRRRRRVAPSAGGAGS